MTHINPTSGDDQPITEWLAPDDVDPELTTARALEADMWELYRASSKMVKAGRLSAATEDDIRMEWSDAYHVVRELEAKRGL